MLHDDMMKSNEEIILMKSCLAEGWDDRQEPAADACADLQSDRGRQWTKDGW